MKFYGNFRQDVHYNRDCLSAQQWALIGRNVRKTKAYKNARKARSK